MQRHTRAILACLLFLAGWAAVTAVDAIETDSSIQVDETVTTEPSSTEALAQHPRLLTTQYFEASDGTPDEVEKVWTTTRDGSALTAELLEARLVLRNSLASDYLSQAKQLLEKSGFDSNPSLKDLPALAEQDNESQARMRALLEEVRSGYREARLQQFAALDRAYASQKDELKIEKSRTKAEVKGEAIIKQVEQEAKKEVEKEIAVEEGLITQAEADKEPKSIEANTIVVRAEENAIRVAQNASAHVEQKREEKHERLKRLSQIARTKGGAVSKRFFGFNLTHASKELNKVRTPFFLFLKNQLAKANEAKAKKWAAKLSGGKKSDGIAGTVSDKAKPRALQNAEERAASRKAAQAELAQTQINRKASLKGKASTAAGKARAAAAPQAAAGAAATKKMPRGALPAKRNPKAHWEKKGIQAKKAGAAKKKDAKAIEQQKKEIAKELAATTSEAIASTPAAAAATTSSDENAADAAPAAPAATPIASVESAAAAAAHDAQNSVDAPPPLEAPPAAH